VHVVNVIGCQPDEDLERGAFGFAAFELTDRLGANVLGATVYEMSAGQTCWPYHYHHGVEEWLYVVSGVPVLRDPSGERALEPGDLLAFSSGPDGAHTVRGPGRVVIFSAGARGWGEAFVTVYPGRRAFAETQPLAAQKAPCVVLLMSAERRGMRWTGRLD
jgi:uncharacterized cupin superfamily protein